MKKLVVILGVLVLGCLNQTSHGQQQPPAPQLVSIFPAGGKIGETTAVKILEQIELEFADDLIFSHPGITAKPKMRNRSRFFPTAAAVRNEFLVTIGKDVPPGVYDVRAKCEYGISNPRRFVVSKDREVNEAEPNNSADQATELFVNSVGNGLFEAGYDYYKVKVQPGQSLVFRCVAEQIDSKGDPVMALYDSRHQLIRKNHDANGKDSLVSFQASKEEEIFIRVNDLTYVSQGGAGTTPYRLMVTETPWIDFVDPPIIPVGVDTKITLVGRNLGGGQSGIYRDGVELESLNVILNTEKLPATSQVGFAETHLAPSSYSANRLVYQFEGTRGRSNPVVIELSDGHMIKEADVKNELKRDSQILGVFSQPGEIDHYRFVAKKGERYWIEVVSQRLGIGTDPLLTIESIQKNKDGEESLRTISTTDDFQPLVRPFRIRLETEDPALIFVAPNDGEYRISINDQFNLPPNQNGPNYYKLTFAKPGNHVDLVAIPGLECGQNDNHSRPLKVLPCIVRPNAGAEIQVFAYRAPGFDSTIELMVEGLPAGVTAHPCIINGKSGHGTVVLSGAPDLKDGFGKIRISGRVNHNGKTMTIPVAGAEIVTSSVGNEPADSRLTDEMWVIAESQTEFPGKIELSETRFETAVGGVLEPKAKLTKHPNHKGSILQGYLHGLPRTVTRNSNTIPDNGTEVGYKIDFRQGSAPGDYSVFVRGYFEKNAKRYSGKMEQVTAEQKRISGVVQKVEAEYRNASRSKQTATSKISQQRQQISRLATQVRSSATMQTTRKKGVDDATIMVSELLSKRKAIEAAIKSLGERSGLEKDVAKKKALANELQEKKQQSADLELQIKEASQAVDNARAKMVMGQGAHDKLVADESLAKRELEKLEKQLTEYTELEQKLAAERVLGQSLKREIDQELTLARNASRERRCRFLVYSEPIQIKVAEYPIEIGVSKAKFVLQQGQSEMVKVNLKRLFDYKGTVTVELRPGSGANGWAFKKSLQLTDGQNEGEAEIFVQKYAKVGTYAGEFRATMRNGNANLTKTIPVEFEVKAAPKK